MSKLDEAIEEYIHPSIRNMPEAKNSVAKTKQEIKNVFNDLVTLSSPVTGPSNMTDNEKDCWARGIALFAIKLREEIEKL